MAEPILMPALSPTMTEGKIARWLIKEGSPVRAGDALCEIETDKAVVEFEAVDEGILGKIVYPDGSDGIAINTTIGWVLGEGEDASAIPEDQASSEGESTPSQNPATGATDEQTAGAATNELDMKQSAPEKPKERGSTRVFASPLARRLAREKLIDLAAVKGSGPRGRIILRDIESFAVQGQDDKISQIKHVSTARADGTPSLEAPYTVRPLSTMRKTVARRLTESKTTIPHFYLTKTVEVDRLFAARSYINRLGKGDYKISVNDCIIKAVAMAMRRVPEINVSLQEDGLHCYHREDISVAVSLEDGLITPVVRDVAHLGLKDISSKMGDLVARARAGKLLPEEYTGGSLTISNLGMFGIDHFQAILNPPQASILAVGQSQKLPRFNDDGSVRPVTAIALTLSVDHRAIDGAIGARFLSALEDNLNEPALMLV